MFSLGDELCGGFFYEVAFFNLVLSVCKSKSGCIWEPASSWMMSLGFIPPHPGAGIAFRTLMHGCMDV